jgi:hypothetical protein
MQATAAGSSRDGGNAQVIFTKWVTTQGDGKPVRFNMAGVVSGDVGGGQFVGEILDLTPPGPPPPSRRCTTSTATPTN